MIPARYSLIRYVPDAARDEELNVGIVAWTERHLALEVDQRAVERVLREKLRRQHRPRSHQARRHTLAESVRNSATPYIFDVLVLSSDGERELAFIRTERASRIWPRDAPRGAETATART